MYEKDHIKKIEDLSLNAWPSHQMQIYDGWILRFSYFYTHRTNCAEEIGPSHIALSEKIAYCEDIYRWWKTPCIFKITPISTEGLDRLLAARGYEIQHTTDVMCRSLDDFTAGNGTPASDTAILAPNLPGHPVPEILPDVTAEWLSALSDMKGGILPEHARILPGMYAAIPKEKIPVVIRCGGRIAAIGLGILDRNDVGVYAIHTDAPFRRRGFASAIIRTILATAARKGAGEAYLQVVNSNSPAKALYRDLGFRPSYTCWYRFRDVTGLFGERRVD